MENRMSFLIVLEQKSHSMGKSEIQHDFLYLKFRKQFCC